MAAEGLVVAVLILVGLVQSLCFTSWWDWGIEVEHLRDEQGPHCGEAKTRGKVTGSLGVKSITHYILNKAASLQQIQLQYDERALNTKLH